MDFLIASTTTYRLTEEALDLINFFSQLITLGFAISVGLLTVIILLIIFKP